MTEMSITTQKRNEKKGRLDDNMLLKRLSLSISGVIGSELGFITDTIHEQSHDQRIDE